MSYIRRSLEKIVLQVIKEYPVLLLSGPRQVGKTTMLKKLMEGTERMNIPVRRSRYSGKVETACPE